MNTGRASGEDDAFGAESSDLFQRHIKGVNLAVDMAFPDPPGDQLGGLGAKVQNQDAFFVKMIGRHEMISCQIETISDRPDNSGLLS